MATRLQGTQRSAPPQGLGRCSSLSPCWRSRGNREGAVHVFRGRKLSELRCFVVVLNRARWEEAQGPMGLCVSGPAGRCRGGLKSRRLKCALSPPDGQCHGRPRAAGPPCVQLLAAPAARKRGQRESPGRRAGPAGGAGGPAGPASGARVRVAALNPGCCGHGAAGSDRGAGQLAAGTVLVFLADSRTDVLVTK